MSLLFSTKIVESPNIRFEISSAKLAFVAWFVMTDPFKILGENFSQDAAQLNDDNRKMFLWPEF